MSIGKLNVTRNVVYAYLVLYIKAKFQREIFYLTFLSFFVSFFISTTADSFRSKFHIFLCTILHNLIRLKDSCKQRIKNTHDYSSTNFMLSLYNINWEKVSGEFNQWSNMEPAVYPYLIYDYMYIYVVKWFSNWIINKTNSHCRINDNRDSKIEFLCLVTIIDMCILTQRFYTYNKTP